MSETIVDQLDIHQNNGNGPIIISLNAQNGAIKIGDSPTSGVVV